MIWMICNVTTVFIFFCIFLDLTWRWWKRKYSSFPNAPNLPWIGFAPFTIFKDTKSIFKERRLLMKKFDYMPYVFWILWKPLLVLPRADFIEAVFTSKEPITRGNYTHMKDLLGEGLVTSEGEKWQKRRHVFNGAFSFNILLSFVDIFEKNAMSLVEELKIIGSNNKLVDIQKLMRLVALDVICETSMGVNIDALHNPDSDYPRAAAQLMHLIQARLSNPFYLNKRIWQRTAKGKAFYNTINVLKNFTIDTINKNIARRKEKLKNPENQDDSDSKKRVFIDVLLDLYDKGEIDEEGMHDEVQTFIGGGHDTTAVTFSWLIYELGRRPEIQQKVQAEIDEISKLDCCLMDKLRKLEYTECVIKENMRINPSVPRVAREINKDLKVKDVIIPAGTTAVIDIYSVQHNPEHWDDPNVFKPERFKDGKVKPYSYIPFALGSRNCIGQKFAMLELKVFTFIVMSYFNVKSVQSQDELDLTAFLVLYAKNGIQIQFTPR